MTPADALSQANIQHMIERQSHAILATLRQQQPFQHLISHAYSEDLRYIYFACLSNSALSINTQSQPLANLIWDNRSGDVEEAVLEAYLTAAGFVNRLGEMKSRMAKRLLLDRNPILEDFLNEPLAAVYSVQVHTYHYHNGNGETYFYHPNQALADAPA